MIDATASTPPLVDVPTANKILIVQSKIADADRQLTPLLADTANLKNNAAQIQRLVGDMQTAAGGLNGDLGIKDAKTQQSIQAAVTAIIASTNGVIAALQAGGILK